MDGHTLTYIHTYTYTYMDIHVQAYTYMTYLHSDLHTYLHTYLHVALSLLGFFDVCTKGVRGSRVGYTLTHGACHAG